MQLLYFVLCAYGLTQILIYGKIFDKIRPKTGKLGELFRCPMCVGFWAGAFLFCINGLTELFTFDYSIATAFVLSCIGSGVSYVLSMIFGDEGINFKIGSDKNV